MISKTALLNRVEAGWLYLLIFVIPFSLSYLTKQPFAISYLNLISVGFILIVFASGLKLKKYYPIKPADLKWLIGALFAIFVYALIFSSFRNWAGFFISRLFQPFLVGLAAYQLLQRGVIKVENIVAALFFSLIPLVIGGLLQVIGVLPYLDSSHRVTVLYSFPNTFARYIVIILTISLPWLLFSPSSRVLQGPKRVLWLLGGLLLLSTVSYNGIVSFLISLGIGLLFLPKKFRFKQKVTYGVAAIVIVLVALQAPQLPKWQRSINDSRVTRLQFWEVARGVIQDHLWTGIGIKTWENDYPNLVEKYARGPILMRMSPQPHNVFLDSFVKAGFPGFIVITALLLWPIYWGFKYWWGKPRFSSAHWFGLSLFMYGFAMLLFGFIDDPLWSDDTIPLLFIFFFCLAYLRNLQTISSDHE